MSNVLHISHYAAAYKGSFIESLLNLEEYLKKQNIQQIYIFPHKATQTKAKIWIDKLRDEGHIIYFQTNSILKNLVLYRKIKKRHNIKTVFRHFADNKTDICTKIVFKGKNTYHFFRCMYFADKKSIKHRIRKWLIKNNTLIGISDAVSECIHGYFPKNKIATINNAIYFSRLDYAEDFSKADGISCLAMGYDPFTKGTDLAIESVAKLQKQFNLHLYIVAASHLEEIQQTILAKVGEIPEWITILPPNENVATYYNNTDIFLAPSRAEGFSNAVVEASYCKSTVVLSDIPAHRLLKVNQKYSFKSENAEDMADKIELAISDLDSQELMVKKEEIRQGVIKEYNINKWCSSVYNLIK